MNVFDLEAKIGLDTSEYTDKLKGASSLGSKFGGALKTAAKVGVAAFSAISAASIAATKVIIGQAGAVAEYGDNIDKMSQKMGISAEGYQEWEAVMQHSGTSMETLKSGMKTLANAVENGNEAFSRLGITQEQIASMNQEELFNATISALQNVEDETERTYLAGQLLGRGATELGALLNTSAEDTQAMKDRVHELGGVMSDEAVKASAAYQDSLQDLRTAFGGAKRTIIAEFFPAMVNVMDGLSSIVSGDSSGLTLLNEGVSEFIERLSDGVPRVIDAAGDIVSALWTGIQNNLPKIANAGTSILLGLVRGIIAAIPNIVKAGVSVLRDFINAVTGALPELIDSVIDAVESIVDTLLDNADGFVDAGIEMLMALGQGLIDALPRLSEKIPQIINGIVTALTTNLPKLIQAGVELFTALIDNLPVIISNIASALPDLIRGIVDGLLENIQLIVDAGVQLFVALVENLPAIIEGIVAAIPEIIQAILDSLGGLGEAIAGVFSAAWDLVVAAWSGVVTFFAGIWDAIVAVFEGVAKWFGGLFSEAWDAITEAWDSVVKFFEDIWTGITDVFKSVGGWFSDKFSAAWRFIKEAWASVVSFFQGIWDGITRIFEGIGQWFSDVFSEAVRLIKEAWESIVQFFTDIWDGIMKPIKDFDEWLGKKMGTAAEKGRKGFQDGLGDHVPAYFRGHVTDPIKRETEKSESWGRDMVQNFISGIEGKQGALNGIVSQLMQGVKARMGFSEPELGPLSDFHTYAPDLMKLFAQGIRDNSGLVYDALENSLQFEPIIDDRLEGYGGGASGFTQNVNIYAPKALTPYEVARQTRNATQAVALQLRGVR